jgi:DNA-binding NarL/FixJ family response regulator
MAITLIVADDQEAIRKGLARLLAGTGIEIIAAAVTGREAIAKTKRHKPDVVLLDVRMPDIDGLDALEKIRQAVPKTKILVLSGHDNPTYLARAAALGAEAFLLKDTPGKELVATIKRLARGGAAPKETPLSKMKAELDKRLDPAADDVPLTRREYQVLRHMAFGLSNREIAKSLAISIETVKEHVQNLLRKLKVADRTEAAVWAMQRKLV